MTYPGLLIVVSAPSGAGKTSILEGLFSRHSDLRFSVSATTRPPRPGERDGVEYHFITDDAFDRHIREGAFVEWAQVHGNRYGTLRREVEEAISNGSDLILDTDTVGAANIRAACPEAVLVFIAPPSPEELRDRLTRRNTESPESFIERQHAVPREMARMTEYDYIIINKTLNTAVSQLEAIIEAEHLRTARVAPRLTSWRNAADGHQAY